MSYHFIGIGGIGMSGLAKLLIQKEKKVKGSDITSSAIVKELKKLGAEIFLDHSSKNINKDDIVIYSSAIDSSNPELLFAKENCKKVIHRSQLLQELMEKKEVILVAGTHGKTTTTALLTEVFINANLNPSYSIGGILNRTLCNACYDEGKYFIAEADESDGSFLNYEKNHVIVTNLEKEHLDYWGDFELLKSGFSSFVKTTKDSVVFSKEDEILKGLGVFARGRSFGFSPDSDVYAQNIRQKGMTTVFDIYIGDKVYYNIKLNLIGRHNVLNALSVFSLATKIGIDERIIFESFASFSGVKRRLEKIGEVNKTVFIEDYAHHPNEIKTTLESIKKVFKERRLVAIFQPHKYSRTHFLFDLFLTSFESADTLFISDIYSAKEKNKYNISSKDLVNKISHANYLSTYKDLEKKIRPHDIVVFLGAGDISKHGRNVYENYKKKPSKIKVALLYGGESSEHDVSIVSANAIKDNLSKDIYDIDSFYISKEGKWFLEEGESNLFPKKEESLLPSNVYKKLISMDVCIPIFHGPRGEDGMIQGFLETLKLPYVGADYLSAAAAMNKAWTKNIAEKNGFLISKGVEISKNLWKNYGSYYLKEIKKLKLPIYIKPSHLGSSVGVYKKNSFENIENIIDQSLEIDRSLVIEQEIIGQEIEVAVMGNDIVRSGVPGEILSGGEFYDYDKKYGENGFETQIPANLSSQNIEKVKNLAEKLYKLIGLKGMARIDFFYSGGNFYLNEINPIPGFTTISLYPKMWKKAGLSYSDLMDELIVLALEKQKVEK